MNIRKTKIFVALFFLVFAMFLSNDFGLINIEKTAIVTALAIDKGEKYNYKITVQVAVPEAGNANTENPKATISGEGDTVAGALKDAGSLSGWYLKLSFCNLLIIGNSLTSDSVIKELDFFAKTLNVQDSSLVITTDNNASELLEKASPLDNISSFALQKVLLKEPGFDSEVLPIDLREFVNGIYSKSSSAYMPLVKMVKQDSSSSGESKSSGGSESKDEKVVFDATTTALFKNGIMVGMLNKEQTFILKMLKGLTTSTTFPISALKDGEQTNYLINALRTTPKIKVSADNFNLEVDIFIDVYCKVVDQNAPWQDSENSRNVPLDSEVINASKEKLEKDIKSLIEIIKQTDCDLLGITDSVYKYHYPYYNQVKDFCVKNFTEKISVNVKGQK
ncbi:MAG: Ger(x)C family spore germination protein [Clostridia bacterium]|nr:Ger(x)C family spore germination protein [Clostridia bacterium]